MSDKITTEQMFNHGAIAQPGVCYVCDAIRSRLTEYDALKGAGERLTKELNAICANSSASAWSFWNMKARAETAEAELELARPLLEAAMEADVEMGVIPFCRRGSERLLREVIAYRAAKEGK